MKKLLYLLFISSSYFSATAQQLNFEAVDYYFTLTESLRQDIPLSDESWNKLIAYEGVQIYINNNGLDEQVLKSYRRNFEVAYMPRYDSILQARLQKPENYFVLWVFNNYKTQEKELKSYYQQLKSDKSAYLDTLYTKAYTMLPKKMQTKAEATTIYFTPLMNDAVAEESSIVLTLYGAYHYDKLKYGALGGHEIHHVLRKTKQTDSTLDQYLYDALALLLNEGSADLIDKKLTASPECPPDLQYYEYLMEYGPSTMAVLDSAVMYHAAATKQITKKDLQTIAPMSGHIPGCYMATVIARNGLEKEMISAIDDPVKFFLIYNKAAKIDEEKPYHFSDQSISYIRKIKQKKSS
jgi:hypothetical protein